MKYPIFQISEANWNKFKEFDVEYSDVITIINTRSLVENFLNSEYIDSNGAIFKVTDYEAAGFVAGILKYVPLIPFKVKLIFTATERKLNLEEFRELILKRMKENEDYNDYRELAIKAKTYDQLMGDY